LALFVAESWLNEVHWLMIADSSLETNLKLENRENLTDDKIITKLE
jgi:hypothetical protein